MKTANPNARLWPHGNYPQRGEVYIAVAFPGTSPGFKKSRPVVVISNNASNKFQKSVTVVPLSSSANLCVSTRIPIESCGKTSVALCENIRPIPKAMLGDYKIKLSDFEIDAIERGISVHVGIG